MSDDFNFNLGSIQGNATGLDAFFEETPSVVTPLPQQTSPLHPVPKAASRPTRKASFRRKVASLADLSGFVRVAEDQLINKSDRQLWSLKSDGGDFYIERLFDDNTPLKG